MQLFHLAKQQLMHMQKQLPKLQAEAGSTLLEEPELPILTFDAKGNPLGLEPGEAREFKGINLLVGIGENQEEPDLPAITNGINDFVQRALIFAFNPLNRNVEPTAKVRLMEDEDHNRFLRFHQLDTEKTNFLTVGLELDKLEELMFDNWRSVPGMQAPFVRKKFITEAECERAEALIDALGRAAGYTRDEIETQFDVSPNDRCLTVHKDFMETLARVEETMYTQFGGRKHG